MTEGHTERKIITFYSYKGGVGRSMAVANIGRLLARRCVGADGRTLLIDWDLEAPGLNLYFSQMKPAKRGLIDYFKDLEGLLDTSAAFRESMTTCGRAAQLQQDLPIENYAVETGVPGLFLMTACETEVVATQQYQQSVGSFDWVRLCRKYPDALHAFRELVSSLFRYVLIDSRTGISDVSGICTSIMPEKLVIMFGPNNQNLRVLDVVEAAVDYRRLSDDKRPLIVFPLASRFDHNNQADLQVWTKTYRDEFAELFKRLYSLGDCNLYAYFRDNVLLHAAHYSYGERIAVERGEPEYPGSLRRSYEAFAGTLVDRDVPWQQ